MNKKLTPFVENIAESGAACLVTMVQGNLLLLGAVVLSYLVGTMLERLRARKAAH